jgi:hypothetical protein
MMEASGTGQVQVPAWTTDRELLRNSPHANTCLENMMNLHKELSEQLILVDTGPGSFRQLPPNRIADMAILYA